MPPTMLEKRAAEIVRETLADPDAVTGAQLEKALRILAIWRSRMIDEAVVRQFGVAVQAGPFRGMRFAATSCETNASPKLLGTYETPIHDIIERIIATDFDYLIDVGSADGYYCVGLATRMSRTKILAFDSNPVARDCCRKLAVENGVADRVEIGETFTVANLTADFADKKILLFVDIEGAEEELLDPAAHPVLAGVHVFVECHDVFRPGLSKRLTERFSATHRIERIESTPVLGRLPDAFWGTSDLDKMLAQWEWRRGPTPWLYMVPEQG